MSPNRVIPSPLCHSRAGGNDRVALVDFRLRGNDSSYGYQ